MTKRPLALWFSLAVPLAFGLALRCWFIAHAPPVAGDSLVYGKIATNWMQHGAYGFDEAEGIVQPTLIRLPGYPLFLALCFRLFGDGNYPAVMYAQAAVDLLSCLLAAALAGRLFGSRARTAALWMGALCPFTATYVAAPLTETLTLFTIALAFYALARWQAAGTGFNRWLWLTAIAVSYGILLRPDEGLLAAAIFPAMLWVALRPAPPIPNSPPRTLLLAGTPVLVAALCTLLPLVPWTIRNERTFHVLQPLAPRFATDPGELIPLGFQQWYRTWAIDFASTEDVYWNYNGAAIQPGDLPTRAFDSPAQQIATQAILDDYNKDKAATPELDARFAALAQERIANHPLRYFLGLPVARLANMLLRPRTELSDASLEWWKGHEHRRETAFALFYATLNLAYFVAATAGFIRWRRSRYGNLPLLPAMLAFILLRCALLLTLDNSEPRYTLEFFPILFVLAAALFASPTESSQLSSHSA